MPFDPDPGADTLLSADVHTQAAYEFCESVQAGRGEVFVRDLDMAIGQLRTFPENAPGFQGSYRRLLVHGFPCGIFCPQEGGRIIVSGVMDLRQAREVFRRRLR